MRVRMLEDVASVLGTYDAGSTCDIPDAIGNSWCSAGLAMMDKSLDKGKETKKVAGMIATHAAELEKHEVYAGLAASRPAVGRLVRSKSKVRRRTK